MGVFQGMAGSIPARGLSGDDADKRLREYMNVCDFATQRNSQWFGGAVAPAMPQWSDKVVLSSVTIQSIDAAAAFTAAWLSHTQAETANAARVAYPGAWPPPRVATPGIKFV
jgi:hypothetical protein